jgi:hypothetical protein
LGLFTVITLPYSCVFLYSVIIVKVQGSVK